MHAQTLGALLVEMDGFAPNAGVVILAATNQVTRAIMAQFWRNSARNSLTAVPSQPVAFMVRARAPAASTILHVPPPDVGGRHHLLGRLGEKLELDAAVDLDALARSTSGLSAPTSPTFSTSPRCAPPPTAPPPSRRGPSPTHETR